METKDKIWYLEHFDILKRLKKDDILSMEKAMLMRKIDKNTLLHFPEMKNRYVYFLKEGIVKISSQDKEGREFIKYIIKPGYLFGEMALLENREDENNYAVTLEDCVVCFMDAENLKSMMQMNSELNIRIRKLIGLRIKKVENRLQDLVFKDAPTRVHDFLSEFAQEFGISIKNGYKVRMFLNQEDIAKLTATTRQTVATIMNKLRDNRMIDYNNHYLEVYLPQPLIGK